MKFQDALEKSVKKFSSTEFIEMIRGEDDLMVRHLPILKKINKMGFLTLESQGGHNFTGNNYRTGEPFETKERAYLMGFMSEKKAIEFIKIIGIFTDKNVINVYSVENFMNIPRKMDIPLTIDFSMDEIEIRTSSSTILPKIVWEQYLKEAKIDKSEKVVYLLCWDSKWCRDASGKSGLFTDILDVLQKIN